MRNADPHVPDIPFWSWSSVDVRFSIYRIHSPYHEKREQKYLFYSIVYVYRFNTICMYRPLPFNSLHTNIMDKVSCKRFYNNERRKFFAPLTPKVTQIIRRHNLVRIICVKVSDEVCLGLVRGNIYGGSLVIKLWLWKISQTQYLLKDLKEIYIDKEIKFSNPWR
jgi:hypothetical protein